MKDVLLLKQHTFYSHLVHFYSSLNVQNQILHFGLSKHTFLKARHWNTWNTHFILSTYSTFVSVCPFYLKLSILYIENMARIVSIITWTHNVTNLRHYKSKTTVRIICWSTHKPRTMRVKTKYSQQAFVLSEYMWHKRYHMENTKQEHINHLFFLSQNIWAHVCSLCMRMGLVTVLLMKSLVFELKSFTHIKWKYRHNMSGCG